ncbi:MAG: 3-isopropylmalate dehydratase small subunit [SAR202 cluster bacterium]|nr:3-isopropylmalate dehydratase small subunit [SAR202 cluster bacterium]
MDPFKKHTGLVLPMDRAGVDTDQIIPAVFLKKIDRVGFGELLFHSWRYLPNGQPNPDFILNKPQYKGATVMVAGDNFGCGSSREHAPWALQQYGFRAIIAPSFADIFRNNCYQNGLLPVVLPDDAVQTLMSRALEIPNYRITVDLENTTVSDDHGFSVRFPVDAFAREKLLNGWDDIAMTLTKADAITKYERTHVPARGA